MAPRAKAATSETPVSHRFKTSGEGRIKTFSCSCGQWNMTGSEKRVKAIREAWDQHAEKGGLASVRETSTTDTTSGTGTSSTTGTASTSTTGKPLDLGDTGSSGSDSGSGTNQ